MKRLLLPWVPVFVVLALIVLAFAVMEAVGTLWLSPPTIPLQGV